MYSTPLYFADAQITDAFENLPIHPFVLILRKVMQIPFASAQKEIYFSNIPY